MNKSCSLEVLI